MLTYEEIIKQLEDKRSLLVDTFDKLNVPTDNLGLLHLIDIVHNIVSDTPYFITTKKEISFVMRGSGIVTFINENGATVDEVLLRNDDETSISLSLPNDKNNLVFINGLDNVTELDLHDCGLLRLNINYNETIKTLKVYNNHLEDIDVTGLKALQYFHIYNNPIVDNCLDTAFTESDKWDGFPIVNKTCPEYQKLLNLMQQLQDRTNKSLGSVVLYPWYGLETLIYESDGNHYRTPIDGYDFTSIPDDATEKLEKGVICKYPRRLRFISLSKNPADAHVSNYTSNTAVGESHRKVSGHWFTDQPLTEVIYNSDDQEDTLRSLNTVINGIEFKDNSPTSVLYALIRGYDIDDVTKNSDTSKQYLDYYTFDRDDENIITRNRHPLTKYNELRKSLETDVTVKRNWFFGSAIQNTDDFNYCDYYFRFSGAHLVWESVQKGFGRVWGIHDNTSGNQPDWNRKNIVRFTHFHGNVADAPDTTTRDHYNGTDYLLTKVYRTDPRLKLFTEDIKSLNSNVYSYNTSSKKWIRGANAFGHGDHIVSYLLSQGENNSRYDDVDCNFKLFGICPNATGYILDRIRSQTTPAIFTQDYSHVYISSSSPESVTPSSSTLGYIYRCETDSTNHRYTIMKTIQKTSSTYEAEITEDVQILPAEEKTGFRSSLFGSFYLAMKELYEYSDASSMSWSLGDSNYFRYLNGRFGERRYLAQSSGNDGDGSEASTETDTGRNVFGPYGDYTEQSNYKYHTTSFNTSALSSRSIVSSFAHSSSGINHKNTNFSDYNTSIGSMCRGYAVEYGNITWVSGTSMSTPIASGTMLLMMNLYKLINPQYQEEPEYQGSGLTSEIVTNRDGFVTGGYGKFSIFSNYVNTHWMDRPSESMTHQQGLGAPTFFATPSEYKISNKVLYDSNVNVNRGTMISPFNTVANPEMRFTIVSDMKTKGVKGTLPKFTFDCAVVNDNSTYSQIVPVTEGAHNIYICDNLSAWGDRTSIIESNNISNHPDGYDTYYNTYHFYPATINSSQSTVELKNSDHLELHVDENSYITLTPCNSSRLTIMMKMRLDESILPDSEDFTTGVYNPVVCKLNSDQITSEISFNVNVNNRTISIDNSSSLKVSVTFNNPRLYLPVQVSDNEFKTVCKQFNYLRAGTSSLISLKALDQSKDHIYTYVFDHDVVSVYINGTRIGSAKISKYDLDKIMINGNLLTPTGLNSLKLNLSKNILVYDRVLTDAEIVNNSIYLLQQEND